MLEFLDALIRGVQIGSIYAIVGLGLNVIFAATGVFNFGQGEMVMVGAMLGVSLWVSDGLPLGVAVVGVVAAAGTTGAPPGPLALRRPGRPPGATPLGPCPPGCGGTTTTRPA